MKTRPNTKQRTEIRIAQMATKNLRDELLKRRKFHPLAVGKIQSREEIAARRNPYGSKAYRVIFPARPMSRAEIKNALK